MKTTIIITLLVLWFIYGIYTDYRDRDKYCRCKHHDDHLWLYGYCDGCGKRDNNWYP